LRVRGRRLWLPKMASSLQLNEAWFLFYYYYTVEYGIMIPTLHQMQASMFDGILPEDGAIDAPDCLLRIACGRRSKTEDEKSSSRPDQSEILRHHFLRS